MNLKSRRQRAGFSLIEVMIVVAIIAIISGLSWAGYQEVAKRGAAQAGAFELVSALHQARSRAVERGHNVWFIVFCEHKTSALSSGAYCILDDPTGGVASAYGGMTADTNVGPSNPSCKDWPGRVEYVEFDGYPGKSPHLVAPTQVAGKVPYTAVPTAQQHDKCSFCKHSGGTGNAKGAIVFAPSGSASFRDDTGAVLASGFQALGVGNRSNPGQQYKVVVAPTGYIAVYSSAK